MLTAAIVETKTLSLIVYTWSMRDSLMLCAHGNDIVSKENRWETGAGTILFHHSNYFVNSPSGLAELTF